MLTDILLLTLFPAAMAFAAAMDLVTMTIPNRIAILLVLGFFALAPFAGLSLAEIGVHVAVGAAMLAAGFALFALGWVGGGDAKLFAATALWFGLDALLTYAVIAALLGGVLTLALLFWRRLPLPEVLSKQAWIERLHRANEGVPYGIALAIAGLIVYPQTPFMPGVSG